MGTNIKNCNNMCFGCPVNCCKMRVRLSIYDIARIAILEKKDIGDFVVVADAEENNPASFKARGKIMIFELNRKNSGCIFSRPNKKLKCSIEDSKPSLCLAYPFLAWGDEQLLCSKIVCPPENLQRLDQTKMTKKILKDSRWEWKQYHQMVADWNSFARRDEPVEDFLNFSLRETALESTPWGSIYRRIKRPFLRVMH